MKHTKKLIVAGLCLALCVVLPLALHGIPKAGVIFSPMHIPVLLCGLVCGPWYGLACGVLGPALSAAVTGMPAGAMLPSMICELAVYGLVAGLLMRLIKVKSKPARVWLALILAMLLGRMAYGAMNALIFRAGDYSMQLWLTSAFVTALPGIVIQLLLIPAVALALDKVGLIRLGE